MASKNRNKVTNLQQLQQRSEELKDAGYTDCTAPGAADLNYPTSALRRSRTIGGQIGECTHGCQQQSVCVCGIINRKRNDL